MCREVEGRRARAWRVRAATMVVPAVLAMPLVAPAQPAASGDGAPSEAARRAAMSPFRMILQNADAARAKPAPAPAPVKKAAPAAAVATERPAAHATAS